MIYTVPFGKQICAGLFLLCLQLAPWLQGPATASDLGSVAAAPISGPSTPISTSNGGGLDIHCSSPSTLSDPSRSLISPPPLSSSHGSDVSAQERLGLPLVSCPLGASSSSAACAPVGGLRKGVGLRCAAGQTEHTERRRGSGGRSWDQIRPLASEFHPPSVGQTEDPLLLSSSCYAAVSQRHLSRLATLHWQQRNRFLAHLPNPAQYLEQQYHAATMRLFFLLLLMDFAAGIFVLRVADSVFSGDSLGAIYTRQAERCRGIQGAVMDCFSPPRPKPLRPIQQIVLPPLAEYLGQALALFYEACECPPDCLCCGDASLVLPWTEHGTRQKDFRPVASVGEVIHTNTGSHTPPPRGAARLRKTGGGTADSSCISSTPVSSSPFSAFSGGKDGCGSLTGKYDGPPVSNGYVNVAAFFRPDRGPPVRRFPFVSLGYASSPLCLTSALRELLLHLQTLQQLRGLDGNFPHCHGVPSALFLFEFLQRLAAVGSVKRAHCGALLRQVMQAREESCTEASKSGSEFADTASPEGRLSENSAFLEGVRENSSSERSQRVQVDFWKTLPLLDEDAQHLLIRQHLDLRRDLKSVLARLFDTRKWLRQEFFKTKRHGKPVKRVSSSSSAATLDGVSDTVSEWSRQEQRESGRRLLAAVSPSPASGRMGFLGIDSVLRGPRKRTPDSSARSSATWSSLESTSDRPGCEGSNVRHNRLGERNGAASPRGTSQNGRDEQVTAEGNTAVRSDRRRRRSADGTHFVEERSRELGLEVIDEECEERLLSEEFSSGSPRRPVNELSLSKETPGDGESQLSPCLSSSSLCSSHPRGCPCRGVSPCLLSCVSSCYSSNLLLSTATHSFQSCRPYKTALSASLGASSLPLPSVLASPDTAEKTLGLLVRPSLRRSGAGDSRSRDLSLEGLEPKEVRGIPVGGLQYEDYEHEAPGYGRASGRSLYKKKSRAKSEDYRKSGVCSSREMTKRRKRAVPVFLPIAVRIDHRELLRRLFLRWQMRQRELFGVVSTANEDEDQVRAVAGIAKLPRKSYFVEGAEGRDEKVTQLAEKNDTCPATEGRSGTRRQRQEEMRRRAAAVEGALEASSESGCTHFGGAPGKETVRTAQDSQETYFARDLALCFQEDVRVVKLAPHATGAVVSFCSPACQLAPGDQLTVYALPRTRMPTASDHGNPEAFTAAPGGAWIPALEMSSYFVDRLWHALDYAPSFRSSTARPGSEPGANGKGKKKDDLDDMFSATDWRGGPFALGSLAAAIRHGLLDAVEALAFIPQSLVDSHITPSKRQGPLRTALALAGAAKALAFDFVETETGDESDGVKGRGGESSGVQGEEQEHITKPALWAFGLPASFLWRLPATVQTSTKATDESSRQHTARREDYPENLGRRSTGIHSSATHTLSEEGSTTRADNMASTGMLSNAVPLSLSVNPPSKCGSSQPAPLKPVSSPDHRGSPDGRVSAGASSVIPRTAFTSSASARHPADDRIFPPLPARSFNTRPMLYRGGSSGALVRSGSYSGPSGGLLGSTPVTTAGRRSSYCAPGSASANTSSGATLSGQAFLTSSTSSAAGVGGASGGAARGGLLVASSGQSIGHASGTSSAGGALRPLSPFLTGSAQPIQGGETRGRVAGGGLTFAGEGSTRAFSGLQNSGRVTKSSSRRDSGGSISRDSGGRETGTEAATKSCTDLSSGDTLLLEKEKIKPGSEATGSRRRSLCPGSSREGWGQNSADPTRADDLSVSTSDYVHLITGALIPRDEFLKPGAWRVELMVGWRQNEHKQALLAPDEGGTPALPGRVRQEGGEAECEQKPSTPGWHTGPELGWVPLLHRRSVDEDAVRTLLKKLVEGKGDGQTRKATGQQTRSNADTEHSRAFEAAKIHKRGKKEGRSRKERQRTASPPSSAVTSSSAADASASGGNTRDSPAREYAFAEISSAGSCDTVEIPSPSQRFFWLSCTTQVLNGSAAVVEPEDEIDEEPGTTGDPSASSSTLSFPASRPGPSTSSTPLDLCASAPSCSASCAPSDRPADASTTNLSSESLSSLCVSSTNDSRLALGPSEALNVALLPNPPIFQRSFALAQRLQSAYPELSYIAPSYCVLPSPVLTSSPGSRVPFCMPGISVHPVYSEEKQQAAFNDAMARVHATHQQIKSEQIDEVRGVWCVKPKQKQLIQEVVVSGDLLPLEDFLEHLRTPPASCRNGRDLPGEKTSETREHSPERKAGEEHGKGGETKATAHESSERRRQRGSSLGSQEDDVVASPQLAPRQADAVHSPRKGGDAGRCSAGRSESSLQTDAAGSVYGAHARPPSSPSAEECTRSGSLSRPLIPGSGSGCGPSAAGLDSYQAGPTILKKMLDRAEALCGSTEKIGTRGEEQLPRRFCLLSSPEKFLKVSTEKIMESLRVVRSRSTGEGGQGRSQGTPEAVDEAPVSRFGSCEGSMNRPLPQEGEGAGAVSNSSSMNPGNPRSSGDQENQKTPGEARGENQTREAPNYAPPEGVRVEGIERKTRGHDASSQETKEFTSYTSAGSASGVSTLSEAGAQRRGKGTGGKESFAGKTGRDAEAEGAKPHEDLKRRAEDRFLGFSRSPDQAPHRLRTAKVAMELQFSPDVVRLRKLHAALADLKAAMLEVNVRHPQCQLELHHVRYGLRFCLKSIGWYARINVESVES